MTRKEMAFSGKGDVKQTVHMQNGQALVEFLAIAFALIPLFLLLPVIAKYQDIAHATQMASRYAAFDAMVRNDSSSTWKPEAQLADEVRRRFYSNPDAAIKTNDTAGDFKAHQNLFWRDPKDNYLIKDLNNDVKLRFGLGGGGASHNDGFSKASDGDLFKPVSAPLQLKARGIYTANVSVALVNLPGGLKSYEPFNSINLDISRSTSLIVDPWTAKDPEQVEARISASPTIFPTGPLKKVSTLTNLMVLAIDWPGAIQGPKLGQLKFWRDVVPEDRLK